jgi:hypothetical protein
MGETTSSPGRGTNNIQFCSAAFDGEKSLCPVLSTGCLRPHNLTEQEKHAVAAEIFPMADPCVAHQQRGVGAEEEDVR